MKKYFSLAIILSFCNSAPHVGAHAEHDKARYVAPSGQDAGRCDSASSPCKTIIYAAQHANKGDQIRLANGNYLINDADTLFYLLSQTIPIKGNYKRQDNFSQESDKNITQLTGVPLEYATELREKGFAVIVDTKGIDHKSNTDLKKNLAVHSRLQKSAAAETCISNQAGDFPCNNIDLLAHVALADFSTNPADANDIWGHYDLNNGKEYALIGLQNGIGIVDVSKPADPQVITTISSQPTIWRDIKVYQKFNAAQNRWQSYAYVTADNASVGLLIIDLSDLPNSAVVVNTDTTDIRAHNVYLSNVDYSTGASLSGTSPYLHIAGSNRNGGAFNSYSLSNPISPTSVFKPLDATGGDYSHDVSSMVITDSRKDTQCVNGGQNCEIFFDFNENNFQLWDKTDNTDPQRLSLTTYNNARYVHSGWYTEDKLVMIVHDELDEQSVGLNTTVRFFEISDLSAPNPIATWTGPTRAIDHNGFVRGNRYYMSNYERGITVLDITDPTTPVEVGFFDTYPANDSASFNGAWGIYPFLPSGNILVSDINSGLYILQDNTLNSSNGSFKFDKRNYAAEEGDTVSVIVDRINGSQGAVQIAWELTPGGADNIDYVEASGILEWADTETDSKTISVVINQDNTIESPEQFFVRLFDPKNGSTLAVPNLSIINIAGFVNQAPTVDAGAAANGIENTEMSLTATASDPEGDPLTFSWTQISGASVALANATTLTTTFTPPSDGNYQFQIEATDNSGASATSTVNVTVAKAVVTPPITVIPSSSGGGSLIYLLSLLGVFGFVHFRVNKS